MSQAQFYDNADRRRYSFLAQAVDTGGPLLATFVGPAGKTGRVREINTRITTDTTVAVTEITVGNTSAVAPAQSTIPIGVAGVFAQMTAAQVAAAGANEVVGTNDVILDADATVEVRTNQGATAGDADIEVVVDWF